MTSFAAPPDGVWRTLVSYRPDRAYEDDAELEMAKGHAIEGSGRAGVPVKGASASGLELMRDTADDWTRLLLIGYLENLIGAEAA